MSGEKLANAIDHSHHLSDLARRYALSPLKGLQKYYGKDLIPFGGGLPSPEYFPFTSISADILPTDAFPLSSPPPQTSSSVSVSASPLGWLWRRLFGNDDDTTHVRVPREPRDGDGGLNLATALQYGPATGLARTQAFIREFTERIYAPAYADWATLIDTGNTDGWNRVARLLLNPGDTVLVEEWTYPSALASARPIDIRWKEVPMDGQGMRPDSLRSILAEWNVERDGPRPRVMYTVPVGQNPSGLTMGLERKKAIYDLCVEYDIIIAEDDPYYVLQVGEYVPKSERKEAAAATDNADDNVARFVASLVPSYLRIDTQGRVIRMDTFSKTIAPGVRLGWLTCSPVFVERLERMGETSTQAPCGLGQALTVSLLSQWTFDGYVRWLRGLRAQYKFRRDFFVDCLAEEFDLVPTPASAVPGGWAASAANGDDDKLLCAYRCGEKARPLLSFVPPSAGMFVWVELYFGDVPDRTDEDGSVLTPERQFWIHLADAGVLAAPGWIFSPVTLLEEGGAPADKEDRQIGHVRFSYTPSDMEKTRLGVEIFARTLREFCRV